MSFVEIPKSLKMVCLRCGHTWLPRGNKKTVSGQVEIRICPKCKSAYWDRKKEEGR